MPLHLKTFEVAKEAGKKGEAVVSRTPLTCCLNIQALSYNSHQVMYVSQTDAPHMYLDASSLSICNQVSYISHGYY